MLLSPDAFIHVPMLAGKIVAPEKSTFRVSLATFEDWDRRAAALAMARIGVVHTRIVRPRDVPRLPTGSTMICGCLLTAR